MPYNCEGDGGKIMSGTDAGTVKLIGGRLCLDFVNAVGGRNHNLSEKRLPQDYGKIRADKLTQYLDLVVWSEHAGLLTDGEARLLVREAERRPAEAQAVFERGLRLREAIYRILKALLSGWKIAAADVAILNQELTIAQSHDRLMVTAGHFSWGWDGSRQALDRMLWVITQSAAELLTAEEISRVRECSGEDCGWLFLDTSRNRSRQWCDMQDCGNLAKVRRFRTRQRQNQ
jgi:predicted RNA-binding Zn ribbon-like protein